MGKADREASRMRGSNPRFSGRRILLNVPAGNISHAEGVYRAARHFAAKLYRALQGKLGGLRRAICLQNANTIYCRSAAARYASFRKHDMQLMPRDNPPFQPPFTQGGHESCACQKPSPPRRRRRSVSEPDEGDTQKSAALFADDRTNAVHSLPCTPHQSLRDSFPPRGKWQSVSEPDEGDTRKSGTLFADECRFAQNKNVAANGSTSARCAPQARCPQAIGSAAEALRGRLQPSMATRDQTRDGTSVTKRSEVDSRSKRDRLRRGVAAEQGEAMICLCNKKNVASQVKPATTMELMIRFELTTSSLPMTCSTY